MKLFLLTLSLEDVPLSLLLATLSVSEAICCTMSWFGTLPSCNERSRSSPDLLDFFFAFFLPTFFGMMIKNTSNVNLSQIDISTETMGTAKTHKGEKELSRKELAIRHIVYFVVMYFYSIQFSLRLRVRGESRSASDSISVFQDVFQVRFNVEFTSQVMDFP